MTLTVENDVVNVALRLASHAENCPDQIAVVEPGGRAVGENRYSTISFAELHADSNRIASALLSWGVRPGTRLALLVRPGIDFISLVFALFKSGAVTILIDPGMGRRNLLRCLAEAEPEGFIAIPQVQAISEPICGANAKSSQRNRNWRSTRASGPLRVPLGVKLVTACKPTS